MNGHNTDNLFRIWSVGCAHGQEVWTLAMSLAAKQMTNYAILGTDVSQQALTRARLGRYDDRQRQLVPQDCQQFIQPLLSEDVTGESNPYTSSAVHQMQKPLSRTGKSRRRCDRTSALLGTIYLLKNWPHRLYNR